VYGLSLLRLFTSEQPIRGISELADQLELSRPTAHRYAATCLELGYLEQTPLRRYRLTRRAAQPGIALLGSLALAREATPILRELRRQSGRTVSLALLEHAAFCAGSISSSAASAPAPAGLRARAPRARH